MQSPEARPQSEGDSPAVRMQRPVKQPVQEAAPPRHVWRNEAWPMRRTNAADEASLSACRQSDRIVDGQKG
jgi:hypothetical protein